MVHENNHSSLPLKMFIFVSSLLFSQIRHKNIRVTEPLPELLMKEHGISTLEKLRSIQELDSSLQKNMNPLNYHFIVNGIKFNH